jgi:hypothetical protein
MQLLGTINATNRTIFHLSTNDDDWFNKLPSKNWLAFVINQDADELSLNEIVKKCKSKNTLQIRVYQNSVDFEKSIQEVDIDKEVAAKINSPEGIESYLNLLFLPKYHNFERGFWEITNVDEVDFLAKHSDNYDVFCLDCNKIDSKPSLDNLIKKMNEGWIPDTQ